MDFSKFFTPIATGLALALAGCATVERPQTSAASMARDRTVQLQIFLDAQNFGPGIVDGNEGEFTGKALQAYRVAKGLPEGTQPDTSGIVPYTTCTVTAEDLAVLGVMAEEPADIAKQKRLPYVGLGELLAERYRTSRNFLAELNPGKTIDELPVGSVVRVPNVSRPFRAEAFPGSHRAAPSTVAATRNVVIDTSVRMLEVREGGRILAAFPITPGSAEHPAPAGEWKIAMSVPWPTFRYDEGVLKRGERTADFHMFPPGPNSPVGILWAGLNRPGTGIHGTAYPETIGRSGSHGCIRLANWDAATFYTLVGVGTPVTIR
ncbi:MAG: L,D-transpeptidase family protein [Chthoniobacterales bacterium]|nr:L,D-transpeptidase family protein [Chthoniobacterales bacterium]